MHTHRSDFPFFLFIMGVAMAYSIGGSGLARPGLGAKLLRRGMILIGLGVMLNAFGPVWKSIASWDLGVALQCVSGVRLPGVLQRIGLVFILASLLIWKTRPRWQALCCLLILLVHPIALWAYAPAAPFAESTNLARTLDLFIFPDAMLYSGSATDPEGVLGTSTALVTTMLGYWCGRLIRSRNAVMESTVRLVCLGLSMILLGWLLSPLIPINKPLWTSSYVLYTGGWAMISLGVCLVLFDRAGVWGGGALRLLGCQAIAVFVGSGILARVLVMVSGPGSHASLKSWVVSGFEVVLTPLSASLAFAVATLGVWWAIAWAMDRAGWILRV